MTKKKVTQKVKLSSQIMVKKLMHLVALVAFFLVGIAGLRAGVSVVMVTLRGAAVMLVILFVNFILLKVMSTYEEISGEQDKT